MIPETNRVIFWNIWGHRVPLGVNLTLLEAAKSTDVFCLTEVTHMGTPYDPVPAVHTSEDLTEEPSFINGLEQLIGLLDQEFAIRYCSPKLEQWECLITKQKFDNVGFGSALMHRRTLNVIDQGDILLELGSGKKSRVLQWIVYEKLGHRYLVAHLHGVWLPDNTKGDAPERDLQSQLVRQYLKELRAKYGVMKVVFGGDLNLDHNTRALAVIEGETECDFKLHNLIKSQGIPDTRTRKYRKYREPGSSKFADWVFVSEAVQPHRLYVYNSNMSSDHAPLDIEFV